MILHGMINNFNETIINDLPSDILKQLKNLKKERYTDNNSNLLGLIWDETEFVCNKFIDTDLLNIEIDKSELLKDIKFHIIFNVYISILNKNKKPLSLRQCFSKNYDYTDDDTDFDYKYYNFDKKWVKSIKSIFSPDYNDWVGDSDFYSYFYKDSFDEYSTFTQRKRINQYAIYADPKLFYTVINSWNSCPYNKKNILGMNFSKLEKFYGELKNVVDLSHSRLSKTINAYYIERIFNISFLKNLSEYIQNKFESELEYRIKYIECYKIIKLLKHSKIIKLKIDKIYKFLKGKYKFINSPFKPDKEALMKSKIIRLTKEKIYKSSNIYVSKTIPYKDDEELDKIILNLLQEKYLDINNPERFPYINSQINASIRLMLSTQLLSIPMIFSRYNYIDIISTAYEKVDEKDIYWADRLKNKFLYLSNYILPLISKTYYYLLYTHFKDIYSTEEEVVNFIKDLLEDYIKNNFDYYNLNTIMINDEDRDIFRNIGSEAFQINVTELIYNYNYYHSPTLDEENILDYMDILNGEDSLKNQVLANRYNNYIYYDNFPFNRLYSNYKIFKNNSL
ncbi:hypothetical protein [Clostridium intestinale]|uniref:hypothetical protein n=1 Tax=Clostridium intestinale TaxID=36845 RepID=UPI002DD6835D|nr:hypothetical protein [Clostridium intestinale]WRY50717.1 hypothetical protein P8F83_18925 [Clostridium intestinale]